MVLEASERPALSRSATPRPWAARGPWQGWAYEFLLMMLSFVLVMGVNSPRPSKDRPLLQPANFSRRKAR